MINQFYYQRAYVEILSSLHFSILMMFRIGFSNKNNQAKAPQKKNEFKCLLENRKYKTFSSIPKENNDYKLFEPYVELEEQMF